MDYSPPGSSLHEISQTRILEWVAIFSSKGSSLPLRDQTLVSCLAGRFFTIEPLGKPIIVPLLQVWKWSIGSLRNLVQDHMLKRNFARSCTWQSQPPVSLQQAHRLVSWTVYSTLSFFPHSCPQRPGSWWKKTGSVRHSGLSWSGPLLPPVLPSTICSVAPTFWLGLISWGHTELVL